VAHVILGNANASTTMMMSMMKADSGLRNLRNGILCCMKKVDEEKDISVLEGIN
jgi:hypothetical protein